MNSYLGSYSLTFNEIYKYNAKVIECKFLKTFRISVYYTRYNFVYHTFHSATLYLQMLSTHFKTISHSLCIHVLLFISERIFAVNTLVSLSHRSCLPTLFLNYWGQGTPKSCEAVYLGLCIFNTLAEPLTAPPDLVSCSFRTEHYILMPSISPCIT